MQNPETEKAVRAVKWYSGARVLLLITLCFTLVNAVLAFVGGGLYFLFSLSLPMYFIYPEGILAGETIDIIFLVISIVYIALVALCWLMSKKHFGWMIGALVLLVVDCYFLGEMIYLAEIMYGEGLTFIVDVIVHIAIIVDTILGIVSGVRLKKLTPKGTEATANDVILFLEGEPAQTATPSGNGETVEEEHNGLPDSPSLGEYDGKKMVVYLSVAHANKQVLVVRKWTATLLVINGQIYAKKKGLVGMGYTLSCNVNGVAYVFTHKVGFTNVTLRLTANGKTIALRT